MFDVALRNRWIEYCLRIHQVYIIWLAIHPQTPAFFADPWIQNIQNTPTDPSPPPETVSHSNSLTRQVVSTSGGITGIQSILLFYLNSY